MSWTRNEVTLLLEEYRKWPNLYKVKSVNYKNRNLRRKALETIEQNLKKIKSDVTVADIQAKFQSLKQTAVKEYKKCRNSCKSGTSPDEIYEPSLWYFDMIAFTFESSVPRKSTDTLEVDGNAEDELLEAFTQDINYGDSQDSVVIYDNEDELAGVDESASEEVISVIVSNDGTFTPEEADLQTQPPPLVDNNVEPKRKKKKMKDDPYLEAVSSSLINLHKKLDIPSTPIPNKSQLEFWSIYSRKIGENRCGGHKR